MPVPNRAGHIHLAVVIVLPEQPLNLTVTQPHKRSHSESRCSGFWQQGKYDLHFLQRVSIRFLRLSSPRIDSCIAGWVLPLEIVLPLCKRENTAYDALDVSERIAAQTLVANFIQPALHGVRPNFLKPVVLAECFQVIFPNIAVALES